GTGSRRRRRGGRASRRGRRGGRTRRRRRPQAPQAKLAGLTERPITAIAQRPRRAIVHLDVRHARRRRRRIVVERHEARRLHIRELVVIHGPEERGGRAREKQQRQRNHDEQNVHAAPAAGKTHCSGRRAPRSTFARPILIAFSTTTSELIDIPSAASSGGTKPSAASGTAARL